MQAMHGSRISFRSRGRLVGCLMALALAASALVLAPAASAAEPPVMLALGDSLAFGYSQEKFEVNFPNEAPALFEPNYVTQVNKRLAVANKKITQINTGCPGDTSDGMVGQNPALGGVNDAAHFPCPYHNVSGLPLHHSLPGVHSGLEAVMSILNKGAPAHPVNAITLNIGGNDELAAVSACKSKVKLEFEEKGFSEESSNPPTTNVVEAITFCIIRTHEETFKKSRKTSKTSSRTCTSVAATTARSC